MKLRLPPAFAAAALACALVSLPASAGSLSVRDTDGSQWTVTEDAAEDAEDFLLKRLGPDRKPDLRFGKSGQTPFTLGADNDSPTSVRVDSTRRVWAAGATMSGNQPQPVVARFGPDGSLDTRWGVQGRVQGGPVGTPVRPNDLLPLADGSVLVAGETPGQGGPKPVVYHLGADGRIDPSFGRGGIWQRPGTESGSAAGLSVGPDGSIVVGVNVHGPKPWTEVWLLNDVPPALVGKDNTDDPPDEDDLRTEWTGNRWVVTGNGGPTQIVPAATLARRGTAAQAPGSAPADTTGQGGFNPFAAEAPASTQPSAPHDADDGGVPWGWIAVIVALALGVLGVLFVRGGKAQPPMGQNARR
jgi:hypothetical protein